MTFFFFGEEIIIPYQHILTLLQHNLLSYKLSLKHWDFGQIALIYSINFTQISSSLFLILLKSVSRKAVTKQGLW